MKRLLVTADDFGASHEVNEAVERDYRAGLLTQASLMVNESAADEAVRIARRNPKLCVGLHLTLCLGKASRVSPLTDAHGNLDSSPMRAGVALTFRKKFRGALGREIEEQFARFLELGFAPGYWDGHSHLHLQPAVHALALPVASQLGFHAVRLVREPGLRGVPLIFRMLSRHALPSLRARGIRFADRTFGVSRSGTMDTRYFEKTVRSLPAGVSEIYYHPGAERHPIDTARVVETATEEDVTLTNWRELAERPSHAIART